MPYLPDNHELHALIATIEDALQKTRVLPAESAREKPALKLLRAQLEDAASDARGLLEAREVTDLDVTGSVWDRLHDTRAADAQYDRSAGL